ncbi:hypothetical protein F5X98DRAFT_378173 [Xylaria grammica]|nr:hypothetical protein F5X98DRAFT_378173 [Xylaria grammica]
MANEAPSGDPIVRRRELADRYKPLEFDAISSLFRKYTNFRTWSKFEVLQRVVLDYGNMSVNVRNTAADKLTTAANLRREAMTLWPAGTEAAQKHWDWIGILDLITGILRTKVEDNTIDSRQKVASATPQAVVNDGSSWVDVDLDIGIKQMAHWRKTLYDIWEEAIADPTKMSGADIATVAAVRYFRQEMAMMYLCYDWFQKSGSFKRESLAYMKKTDPDGIGGAIVKTVDELRKKKYKDIEGAFEHQLLEGYNFPPETGYWLWGDPAKHNNPLYDWLMDMMKEVRKSGRANQTHSEIVIAYLFMTDAINQVQSRLQAVRGAAVRRLTGAATLSRHVYEHSLADMNRDESKARGLSTPIVMRVQAMNRYVMKQLTVPALAVAHAWADYINITLNTFSFMCRRPTVMAHLFDAIVLLGLAGGIPRAAAVDRFCNLFSGYIYPGKGRPRTEEEWKDAASAFADHISNDGQPGRLAKQLAGNEELDRVGKSWARVALTDDDLSATAQDFKVSKGVVVTRGTEEWWNAIKRNAATVLQEPSTIEGCSKLSEEWEKRGYVVLNALLDNDWEKDKDKIIPIVASIEIPEAWLDTLA